MRTTRIRRGSRPVDYRLRVKPVALLAVALLLTAASPASAVEALIDPARPTSDNVAPPSKSVLSERGSSYDSLQSEVGTSVEDSTQSDLAPEARQDASEVNDALKECALQALAASASVAAGSSPNGEGVPGAFVSSAESCLEGKLSNLSPTAEAVQKAAAYLQAGVGGAVANEEPSPPPDPPVVSTESSGGSSIPWFVWVVAGVVVLGVAGRVLGRG